MKNCICALICICLLSIIGCAGIEPPSPERILSNPLGTGPIRVGMTKDEVIEVWGEPDLIGSLGESTDYGRTAKEKWTYHGRFTNLPVNYGYLSNPVYLYFDGNNLTNYEEE